MISDSPGFERVYCFHGNARRLTSPSLAPIHRGEGSGGGQAQMRASFLQGGIMAERPQAAAPFQPFVPAQVTQAELTFRAVFLGAILGLIFGAVTVYLALVAGLTVSASIPVAVLAISIFKWLGRETIS